MPKTSFRKNSGALDRKY